MSLFRLLIVLVLLPFTALAEGKSIIVLDASGSMWGQIDGRTKVEIAREALAEVLTSVPAETELGLMAYGHREKGNCGDIELIVPPAAGTGLAISEAANALKFLGKTPLSDAVRQAAGELRSTEEKATVILITDGIETCNADPCALGSELEASGVDFTAHVVGFGLTEEEGRAVACLAENTGGKYIEAKDAGALTEALKETVAVAEPEPTPAPEPEMTPEKPALDKNIDPELVLADGQDEPERIDDAYFEVFPLAADGTVGERLTIIYGTKSEYIEPGTYRITARLGKVEQSKDVTLTAQELATPIFVMNAAVVTIRTFAFEGGDVDPAAYFELRAGGDSVTFGYGEGTEVVPAGDYTVLGRLATAESEQPVTLAAGEEKVVDITLATGVAVIDGYYNDATKVTGGVHFVEIFKPEKDINGNRESVTYTYGEGASFDLTGGDYVAKVSLGGASAEQPFTVKSGERVEVKVLLNAGVAAVSAPGASYLEVFKAAKDINGNRVSMTYDYVEAKEFTLPAGDYVVLAEKGEAKVETPFSVKPGERTEVSVNLP
jgi:Ca-activated chloride channel homolog